MLALKINDVNRIDCAINQLFATLFCARQRRRGLKKYAGHGAANFRQRRLLVFKISIFSKFSSKWRFFCENSAFLAKNLRQEKNFPTAQNFGWGRAIVPLLPPCHDATGGRDISTVHDCQLLLHFKFAKQTTQGENNKN